MKIVVLLFKEKKEDDFSVYDTFEKNEDALKFGQSKKDKSIWTDFKVWSKNKENQTVKKLRVVYVLASFGRQDKKMPAKLLKRPLLAGFDLDELHQDAKKKYPGTTYFVVGVHF